MSWSRMLVEAGVAERGEEYRAFFLVEGASHRDVLRRLEFHEPLYQPLWRTELKPELERVAPYLGLIEQGSEFDQWLGSNHAALSFITVITSLGLEQLASHLRRFSKFEDQGRRYFLRLGDTASLHAYVSSLNGDGEQVSRLYARGRIAEFCFYAPALPLSQRIGPLFEQKNLPDHHLDGYLVRSEFAIKGAV